MADLIERDFHLDSFLTNFLVGYRPRNFIGDQIFPVIPVNTRTNVFAKIDKGNWFRQAATLRQVGTKPNEVSYTVSSDTYSVINYALSTIVPDETKDNADQPFAPEQQAAAFLADQLMLDFEIRVQAAIIGGVGSSSARTGTNAWSDFANSDPLTDMEVGREAVRYSTGYTPNTALTTDKAWLKIRRHPDIVRAIYPGAGVGGTADLQQFATLIGVDRVLVGRTIRNTGNEGQADAFSDVWSTHLHLLYVEATPGLMTPTFGASFRWTGPNIGANGPTNFGIERKYDDDRKVTILRTSYYQSEKIVASELGFTIATGITA